ncbi:c-type cytochrome [Sphingobium amiense]|nr:cytochrome c family protein [Sphingobium amiense]
MRLRKGALALISTYGLAVANPAVAAGDAAHGKMVFARCAACHSMTPGKKMVGPSLAGIIGRKAGTVEGFTYSPAMKAYGRNWDVKAMDAFLASPKTAIPGTRMIFAGLPNAADRADLIAYLSAAPK